MLRSWNNNSTLEKYEKYITQQMHLDNLPRDILEHVCHFMSTKEIFALRRTSSRLRAAMRNVNHSRYSHVNAHSTLKYVTMLDEWRDGNLPRLQYGYDATGDNEMPKSRHLAKLSYICAAATMIDDLSSIGHMTSVALYECYRLCDISALRNMKNVYLCHLYDVDMSPLGNMNVVQLERCDKLDISPLCNVDYLTIHDSSIGQMIQGYRGRYLEIKSDMTIRRVRNIRAAVVKFDTCTFLQRVENVCCDQLALLTLPVLNTAPRVRCNVIYVRECWTFDKWDQLANARGMNIIRCPRLVTFRDYSRVRVLNVAICERFASCVDNPNLKSLTVNTCPNLTHIRNLESLKYAKMVNCPNLTRAIRRETNRWGYTLRDIERLGETSAQELMRRETKNMKHITTKISPLHRHWGRKSG